jgi:hypothetical protein
MRSRHHACPLVHVKTDVAATDQARLARVNTNPDPDLTICRPPLGRQLQLRLGGRATASVAELNATKKASPWVSTS